MIERIFCGSFMPTARSSQLRTPRQDLRMVFGLGSGAFNLGSSVAGLWSWILVLRGSGLGVWGLLVLDLRSSGLGSGVWGLRSWICGRRLRVFWTSLFKVGSSGRWFWILNLALSAAQRLCDSACSTSLRSRRPLRPAYFLTGLCLIQHRDFEPTLPQFGNGRSFR